MEIPIKVEVYLIKSANREVCQVNIDNLRIIAWVAVVR